MATNAKLRSALQPKLASTGLRVWGGVVTEDYLPELQGKRAIAVYNEMRKGNPIAGGFIRAIEMAFRSVLWSDIPYEETPEGLNRAAFLTSVRNDMEDPWATIIANTTTVLPFGHAPFEMTFKHRRGRKGKNPSKFIDGKVGLQNLDLIPQDTIERWETEDTRSDVIIGITQVAPVSQEEILIPMSKVLNFRIRTEKNNPEGESIFRQAYRPWYFMNNLEAIEGISLERTGAGIPVIWLPKGATTIKDKGSLSDEQAAINIGRQVRVDEQGGLVLHDGWEFKLVRPDGRVDAELFDLAITRHRSNMLISVLAAFLEFGTSRVGSFALASSSRSFFEVALEGYITIIEETFNKIFVPLLFELNGIVDEKLPRLIHTAVGDLQLDRLSKYIERLDKAGYIQRTPVLEDYLKDIARLPKGASVSERQELPEEQSSDPEPKPQNNDQNRRRDKRNRLDEEDDDDKDEKDEKEKL